MFNPLNFSDRLSAELYITNFNKNSKSRRVIADIDSRALKDLSSSELRQMQLVRCCDGYAVCDMCCSDPTMTACPENTAAAAATDALGLGG